MAEHNGRNGAPVDACKMNENRKKRTSLIHCSKIFSKIGISVRRILDKLKRHKMLSFLVEKTQN